MLLDITSLVTITDFSTKTAYTENKIPSISGVLKILIPDLVIQAISERKVQTKSTTVDFAIRAVIINDLHFVIQNRKI